MLTALDYSRAGRSHRRIAVALWGAEEAAEWDSDLAVRARVRRLVDKGELYSKGLSELLLTGKVRAPARPRKRRAGKTG